MNAPPPEIVPGCPSCGVPLVARPRSGRLLGILAGLPAAALFGFSGSHSRDGAGLALAALLLVELWFFLRLGGARLRLEEWRVCPECGDFRISDDLDARLRRAEKGVGRLRYYLVLPALFLLLVGAAAAKAGHAVPVSLTLLPPMLYVAAAAEMMMPRPRSPRPGHRATRILDEDAAGAEAAP